MNEFKQRLTRGFANARRRGYFARESWQCCSSCGCAALPEGTELFIFYHKQDAEHMMQGEPGTFLSWGGDGNELRKCMLEAGLSVEWDGRPSSRLYVKLPPKAALHIPTPDQEYAACFDALLAR